MSYVYAKVSAWRFSVEIDGSRQHIDENGDDRDGRESWLGTYVQAQEERKRRAGLFCEKFGKSVLSFCEEEIW